MKNASRKIWRSVNLFQILICAAIVFLLGQTCLAQEQQATVVINAHKDLNYELLLPVIESVHSSGISSLKFGTSQQLGMSVEIQSVLPAEEYADLIETLSEKGVEDVRVVPLPLATESYSAERLRAVRQGKGAIVFFRADWCFTCAAVESNAFNDPELLRLVYDSGISILSADMTDMNAESEAVKFARQKGVKNIPTFIFFPSDPEEDSPKIEQGVLPEQVLDLFREHLEGESE